MSAELKIEGLHVSIGDKEILRGVDLDVRQGEVHAIMGPNGSGKSTLAYAVMGHPKYQVTSGRILLNEQDILKLPTNERAKKGLFLGFQYPLEVPGVKFTTFMRNAYNALHANGKPLAVPEFHKLLKSNAALVKVDESFIKRPLNEGFSGGEKKRSEVLQMAVLNPKIAILDEPDSGLDIDALKSVAAAIKEVASRGVGVLVITHYQRILDYLRPDVVHVMIDGRIVRSGGVELVNELEKSGYSWIKGEANGNKVPA